MARTPTVIQSAMEVARPGTRWSKASIGTVTRQFRAIRKANAGRLTAELVVAAASDPSNPLHRFFEWDDDVAAEQFRLAQARALIRSVYVIVEEPGKPPTRPARAYVVVTGTDGDAYYESTVKVMKSPAFTAEVMARAKAEMEGWIDRYERFDELREQVKRARQIIEIM